VAALAALPRIGTWNRQIQENENYCTQSMQVTKQINRRNEQLNVHCGFVPDISGKTKKRENDKK